MHTMIIKLNSAHCVRSVHVSAGMQMIRPTYEVKKLQEELSAQVNVFSRKFTMYLFRQDPPIFIATRQKKRNNIQHQLTLNTGNRIFITSRT